MKVLPSNQKKLWSAKFVLGVHQSAFKCVAARNVSFCRFSVQVGTARMLKQDIS